MGRCMCPRNNGGKKVISKIRNLSALSGNLGHFKSEFQKKGKWYFFRIRGAVGCKKVKKKKKEKRKIFHGTFSLEVFLFPVTQRAEKVRGFVFFLERRGKMLNKFKKKRKFFFSPLGSFFTIFGR